MDLVAYRAPARDGAMQLEAFTGLDGPVEGDPAHHPRVSVRAGRASLLPYAVIRLAPDLLEVAEQRFLQSPGIRERTEVSLATCIQHIDELADDVAPAL